MAAGSAIRRAFRYESKSVEHISHEERHGKAWHLFTVWFTPNMNIVALITGAIAVELGLSLAWAIITIILGNGVGALFMASHSAQGPRMGLPQMIQSRAQFGLVGNILPCLATIFSGVAFTALGFVLAAQTLNLTIHTSINVGIVICGVVCFILIFIGYDLIHRYQRYMSLIIAALYILWTIQLATTRQVQADHPVVTVANIVLAISIFASWQISWAPYVSDYSRYLPRDTPMKSVFWHTFAGSFFSSVWGMALGAWAAWLALDKFSSDSLGFMIGLSASGALWILALINFLSQIAPTVLESYTPFLTVVTIFEPFTKLSKLSGAVGRVILTAVVVVIGVVLGIITNAEGIVTSAQNYLDVMLYSLAPWTAINLVDYYLIHRGNYSVPDLFDRNGIYKLVNWRGVIIYLFSVGIEFLFMNSAVFVGPVSHALGGADIAWIVALIVAGGLWYITQPRTGTTRLQVAPSASGAGTESVS